LRAMYSTDFDSDLKSLIILKKTCYGISRVSIDFQFQKLR
jgi:hypothetical protein